MMEISGSWNGFISYLEALLQDIVDLFHDFFENEYKVDAIYVFLAKLK